MSLAPPPGYKVTIDGLVPIARWQRSRRACYGAVDVPAPRDQVEHAKAHLVANWTPSKKVVRHSYGLKHRAEKNAQGVHYCYVSNGALIQAALELGIPVRPDGSQINAWVFVKRRRLTNAA
ncbi:MAG: hypothetical protein QM723_27575 [Myxococcaceae bacterium]